MAEYLRTRVQFPPPPPNTKPQLFTVGVFYCFCFGINEFQWVPKSVPDQRARPYFCHAGYWTIRFGRLCKPDHPSITEAEAVVYLAAEIQSSFKISLRSHPYWPTKPDNRLSAIVDFTLSLGAGRLQFRLFVNESISKID